MRGFPSAIGCVALMAVASASAQSNAPPAALPPFSTPQARQALSAAVGYALQGEVRSAIEALRRVPEREFTGRDASLRACILARFAPAADGSLPSDLPPFAARILGIYRAYWRAALLNPSNRDAEEARLARNLARQLGLSADTPMSAIEPRLSSRLEALSLHALTGRTAPLRELMLWRDQKREVREVPLPEGPRKVNVEMLDGFASLGWSSYATCNRTSTGGWVRPDAIYAVRPGWADLSGEAFRVSFLGHEAQHFSDQERFGTLESWELEFRAKLAELAMAETSLPKLLAAFAANQRDDPAIPHSYANKKVLEALRARLGAASGASLETLAPSAVRGAAEALLNEDSKRRLAARSR